MLSLMFLIVSMIFGALGVACSATEKGATWCENDSGSKIESQAPVVFKAFPCLSRLKKETNPLQFGYENRILFFYSFFSAMGFFQGSHFYGGSG